MFGKKEHKKRGGFLPFVIFRLLLSLTMFCVLALGIYQAFKYFSGVDPIKTDPKTAIISFLASDEAGKFITTIFGITLPKDKNPLNQVTEKLGVSKPENTPTTHQNQGKLLFKFAIVADSHNDNENLSKALKQARIEGAKFVIGLGDYTEVGTVSDLQQAKNIFSSSGLPFYSTAGDHDLWESRENKLASTTNYNQVFGASYQSFSDNNIRFVIVSNADNYEGVDSLQWQWIQDQVAKETAKATYVFMHEPIYHPSSDRFMGKGNQSVAKQAAELKDMFQGAKVGGIFAADIHSFTNYQEPGTGLKMMTVGAITSQRNTQKPRFALVDVLEDGSYNISDIEVK